jgi:hypothetical protein
MAASAMQNFSFCMPCDEVQFVSENVRVLARPKRVGTLITERPRTEPYGPNAGMGSHLPWVGDGELLSRPGVYDSRFGKPVVRQLREPVPAHIVLLAAPPKRAPPEFSDKAVERVKRATVRRHGVVIEVAADDLLQPFPLYGYRLMHAPPVSCLITRNFARIRSRLVFRLSRKVPRRDLPQIINAARAGTPKSRR